MTYTCVNFTGGHWGIYTCNIQKQIIDYTPFFNAYLAFTPIYLLLAFTPIFYWGTIPSNNLATGDLFG